MRTTPLLAASLCVLSLAVVPASFEAAGRDRVRAGQAALVAV